MRLPYFSDHPKAWQGRSCSLFPRRQQCDSRIAEEEDRLVRSLSSNSRESEAYFIRSEPEPRQVLDW